MNKKQLSLPNSTLIDVSDAFSFNFQITRTKQTTPWTLKASLALSPIEKDDLTVLSAIHQGDEDGFLKLIERYHVVLQGFVQTFGGEKTDTEKFMVETWETVLQNLHQFEREYSLKVWIYGVFIEQAQLRFSRPRNRIGTRWSASPYVTNSQIPWGKKEFEEQKYPEFFEPKDFGMSRQKGTNNTNEVTENILRKMELALHQLPLKQKQVMYLRDVERFTSDEVFFLLHINGFHQRRLLQKGRETMRIFLDKALDPPAPEDSSLQLPCSKTPPKPH